MGGHGLWSISMKKYIIIIVIPLMALLNSTAESIQIKDFVKAARMQIGKTLHYDPSYKVLDYPNLK
jgi:uncharacterized protein YijF (DUF1287 family)